MANVILTPHTVPGPPTATDGVALPEFPAGTVLTAAYVWSSPIPVLGMKRLVLFIKYVKGDETTVQIKARSPLTDGGATKFPLGVTQAPSAAGVSEVTQQVLQLTKANFAATDYVTATMDVEGLQEVEIGIQATGGTPTGTFGIWVAGGAIYGNY